MTFRTEARATLKALREKGYELNCTLTATDAVFYAELQRLEAILEQEAIDIEKEMDRLEAPCCSLDDRPSAIVHIPTTLATLPRSGLATIPQPSRYERLIRSKAVYALIFSLIYLTVQILIPLVKAVYKGTRWSARVAYGLLKAHISAQMGSKGSPAGVYNATWLETEQEKAHRFTIVPFAPIN